MITLPVGLHQEAIAYAVKRGIPVLCEKPLVASRTELTELVALAEQTDVVIRVDQNYRLRPWVRSARDALRAAGQLHHVAISFAQPEFLEGKRERLPHPLLDDMTIHHLDLLRYLTGSEAQVLGAWSARLDGTAYVGMTDLDAVLRLDHGALVTYGATWAARGASTPWDANWVFRCGEGTVRVHDLRVSLERPGHRTQIYDADSDAVEHADLLAAWSEFEAAVGGDPFSGVTVGDNERSMSLVFTIQELASAGTSVTRRGGGVEWK
ncbi:Gfo/Idh/MocA family protein [Microbacterium sp. CJ88]|uniref:Gfo/Idh/MocA family protein n=1 Tax=Microbacterium sp. CJ88 TaxID=3445672 RepID=UPI003F65D8AC